MDNLLADLAVLVVDDNADHLFILMEILRTQARVRYVNGRASSSQLFSFVESRPELRVGLILLDSLLSGADSYAVLRRIRGHPQLGGAPVVAVTAKVMAADVERARMIGFDGFIGKPIDPARLVDQVARIMRGEGVWEPR
jgi:two-component system cell cycle response regulator DivK